MAGAVAADQSRMAVDYQLVEHWQRRRAVEEFERRVTQAVEYVERRVEALRAIETAEPEPEPVSERPRLRAVDSPS
jgi:hypothetical protein